MNASSFHSVGDSTAGDWRIVVNSIGDAGAGLLGALKQVSPLSEARLAALLYQAPAELFAGLSRETANQMNDVLKAAGLVSEVIAKNDSFTPGDSDHEIALVIDDYRQFAEICRLVMEVLGVGVEQARQVLCSSPTVLIGKVSANTVEALRQRFEPLGVALDVSRASEAEFDLFLGDCTPSERAHVRRILGETEILPLQEAEHHAGSLVLAVGLSRGESEQIWERVRRTRLPVRLINREFERFDMRLDEAPRSRDVAEFLVASTGMPESIADKVLEQLPVVTHQNIRFAEMMDLLATITSLGGRASGHLRAFQSFALAVDVVEDSEAALPILQALGGLTREQALEAIGPAHLVDERLTHPQARWLQHELMRVGTTCRLVLR